MKQACSSTDRQIKFRIWATWCLCTLLYCVKSIYQDSATVNCIVGYWIHFPLQCCSKRNHWDEMLHGIFLRFFRKRPFKWYYIVHTTTKSVHRQSRTVASQCLCVCKQRSHCCLAYSLQREVAVGSPAAPNKPWHRALWICGKRYVRKNDWWCTSIQCLISIWNYKKFLSGTQYHHNNSSNTFTDILARNVLHCERKPGRTHL